MATKINYRNIPRFLLLLLGAFMLSLIMQERLQLSRPMAIPCALWVVNQLNNNLDIIYALIVIVIIGVLHVQLGDGGGSALLEAVDTGVEDMEHAAADSDAEAAAAGFGAPAEVVGNSEL